MWFLEPLQVEFTILVSLKDGLVSIGGLGVHLFLPLQHLLCLHLWSALSKLVSDCAFLILVDVKNRNILLVVSLIKLQVKGYELNDSDRKMAETLSVLHSLSLKYKLVYLYNRVLLLSCLVLYKLKQTSTCVQVFLLT